MRIAFALTIALASQVCVAAPDQQRLAACGELLTLAQRADVLPLFDRKPAPKVMVGPGFHKITREARAELAAAINCWFTQAEPDACVDFDLVHWTTGMTLGRWKGCKYQG